MTNVAPSPFGQLLDRIVREGAAPGFQGVAFDRSGVLFDGAAGVRALAVGDDKAKPMTTDTIHWLASSTKLPLSIVLLRLLEQGAGERFGLTLATLDDHDALARVLPEFHLDSKHNVTSILVGYTDDGERKPIVRPATVGVTLRRLFTHSAGIAYSFNDELLNEYFAPRHDGTAPHAKQTSDTGRIADFDVPKVREAGEAYDYGHSADWLGQVIVRLAGVNLRQAIIDHILGPLGIPTSQLDISRCRLLAHNDDVSSFYMRNDGGLTEIMLDVYEPQQLDPQQDDPPDGHAYYASACMSSSLSTFARIVQAVLTHDERLLRQSTWRLAEADSTTGFGVRMPTPMLTSFSPTVCCTIQHFLDVEPNSSDDDDPPIGVNLLQAIVAHTPTRSGLQAGAYSWAGIGNTFWFVDPQQGVGGVLGAQVMPFCHPQMLAARNDWERLVTSAGKGKVT